MVTKAGDRPVGGSVSQDALSSPKGWTCDPREATWTHPGIWVSLQGPKGTLALVNSPEGNATSSCHQSPELLGFMASLKICFISFTVNSGSFSDTFFFHFQLDPSGFKKNFNEGK